MSNAPQVFQTSNPTRWKSVKWSSRVVLVVLLFSLTVLVLAVRNGENPDMPNLTDKAKYYQSKLDPSNRLTFASPLNKKFKGFKDFLDKKQKEDSLKKLTINKLKAPQIRGAFYVPWQQASLFDLQKNADKLNTIYPEWFFIDPISFKLQTRIDSAGLVVMKQKGLSIQPIFNNFFSEKAIHNSTDCGYNYTLWVTRCKCGF